MDSILCLIIGAVVGAGGMWALSLLRQQWQKQIVISAEQTAALVLEEAKKEGNVFKKEAEVHAKDIIVQAKADAEKEVRERKRDIQQTEKRIQTGEEA